AGALRRGRGARGDGLVRARLRRARLARAVRDPGGPARRAGTGGARGEAVGGGWAIRTSGVGAGRRAAGSDGAMKVRAALLREMGLAPPYAESRPLAVEEVELGAPGPDEIRVRVEAAGLCHSDLSVIDGSRPRPLPMVLGHEAAG